MGLSTVGLRISSDWCVNGRRYHWWYVVSWGEKTLMSYIMNVFVAIILWDCDDKRFECAWMMVSSDAVCHPVFARIIITVQRHRSSEPCHWIGWFSRTCKTDDMMWAEFNGQSTLSRRFEPFGSNLMMMTIALLTVAKRWVTPISMLMVFCLRVNHSLAWRGLSNDIEHGE